MAVEVIVRVCVVVAVTETVVDAVVVREEDLVDVSVVVPLVVPVDDSVVLADVVFVDVAVDVCVVMHCDSGTCINTESIAFLFNVSYENVISSVQV